MNLDSLRWLALLGMSFFFGMMCYRAATNQPFELQVIAMMAFGLLLYVINIVEDRQ